MKSIKRILALTLIAFLLAGLLPKPITSYAAGDDAKNTQLSSIKARIAKEHQSYTDKLLSPNFNPVTRNYAIIINEDDQYFYLKFEKALNGQSITVTMNGESLVPKSVGENGFEIDGFDLFKPNSQFEFVITVTSPDGTVSNKYIITLYKGHAVLTRNLTVIDGTSNMNPVVVGDEVTITADPGPLGKVFDKWTSSYDIVFDDVNSASTTFFMPDEHVTVIANYKDSYNLVTVVNGKVVRDDIDNGIFQKDEKVDIEANPAPEGQIFDKWTSEDGVVFDDPNSDFTSFTMLGKEVTVTANYKEAIFHVEVINGNGSGNYKAGTKVKISPDLAPTGKMFDKWISDSEISLDSETYLNASFTMPYNDVSVTATYKVGEHNVFVNGGKGGGKYQYNATVTITANPAEPGKMFDKWISYSGITLVDEYSETTSFTMINDIVNVSASYKDAPLSYQVIEGANLTWNKGDEKGAKFVIDGDFNLFLRVKLNGLMIDNAHYSAEEGSVIVTLLPEFLNTQDEGKYDIDFVFEGIEAKTSFTIAKASPTDPSDPKDPVDKEPADKEPVDKEPVDKEPVDKESVDKESADKKPQEKPQEKLPFTGERESRLSLALGLFFLVTGLSLFRKKKNQVL